MRTLNITAYTVTIDPENEGNMDTEAIMAYLNDLGVKTEWEENL